MKILKNGRRETVTEYGNKVGHKRKYATDEDAFTVLRWQQRVFMQKKD